MVRHMRCKSQAIGSRASKIRGTTTGVLSAWVKTEWWVSMGRLRKSANWVRREVDISDTGE